MAWIPRTPLDQVDWDPSLDPPEEHECPEVWTDCPWQDECGPGCCAYITEEEMEEEDEQ